MHTNQLIHETSPYLLQHAHNPVNWYPWGKDALDKAKAENKPILVSIGYAACHWCHVMEKESFEDEVTAALMNEYFINIKIDREERPDLDHIYMDAVQAMTGSGGWPLNVFLTPDCRPFYGGTYFPPQRAFNRISWKEVLNNIHNAYHQRKEEVETQAHNLTEHLISANSFGIDNIKEGQTFFTKANLQQMSDYLLKNADKEWGGFGKAPKFPQTFTIQYLLRHYHFTKEQAALDQALLSLDKMIYGGIYDQLGGGFARYSTDAEWLVPHFEKMLYDNALLIGVMAEAYQLTSNELYATTIHHTMQFLQREMLSTVHGFYSALDADSEGIEGKFYTWGKEEIEQILGEDADLFCKYFDVSEEGNWEHTNILRRLAPLASFAAQENLPADVVEAKLEQLKCRLLEHRTQRIRPLLDDKILLSWNGLMITACCKAYAALNEPIYKQWALDTMMFLEQKMQGKDGEWKHSYKNNIARIPAFLDDYANLIAAYIHLQEITGEGRFLLKAKEITTYVTEHFSEAATGFFYYTHQQQDDVILRKKEVYDGATPSGNAVMSHNLYYLGMIFDDTGWKERAVNMVESLWNAITKYPGSFGVWAAFIQFVTEGVKEIVLAGKDAATCLPMVLKHYVPNKIIQSTDGENNIFPLLAGKSVVNRTAFYLCKNYSCDAPVYSPEEFLAKL